MNRFIALVLAAAALAGSAFGARRLNGAVPARGGEADLLYLPNGKYLRAVSLGHASLLADVVYIWAIQHYSEYGRENRGRYVEHVFGDVIAELDPRYVDPYWLGSLILIVENRDLDAGLRLLDKGFAANPNEWIFPYLAGWECARAQDYPRAIVYFDRAAQVPDAPPHAKRMQAGMFARSGDLSESLRAWHEILDDPSSDESSREIAARQVRTLAIRIDLATLRDAVARFRQAHGRNPDSLEELRAARFVRMLPVDPGGAPYEYDRSSGEVGSSAGRILGVR